MIHLAAEAGGVGVRVEQVGLEPVEAFDAERHLHLAGVLGDGPHAFDAPLPFVLGPPLAGEDAEGRVERADERRRADGGTAIERRACSLRSPFGESPASGLIGLSSAPRTVTAVRARPMSSSILPQRA